MCAGKNQNVLLFHAGNIIIPDGTASELTYVRSPRGWKLGLALSQRYEGYGAVEHEMLFGQDYLVGNAH